MWKHQMVSPFHTTFFHWLLVHFDLLDLTPEYIASDMGFGFNNLHIDWAESPRTLQGPQSGVEHMTSNATVAQYKNQQRREHDKARRDRLTLEQREEMNAHRRAARQNKTNDEKNAGQRAARKNLAPKVRQEINALRRAASKNKPDEERQQTNAR
jgi:hypothetical protein